MPEKSRSEWARFLGQDHLAAVLRCHVAAFEALGGAPRDVYDAIGRQLAQGGRAWMPRALEALDQIVRRLEHGEIGALEAVDILLELRS